MAGHGDGLFHPPGNGTEGNDEARSEDAAVIPSREPYRSEQAGVSQAMQQVMADIRMWPYLLPYIMYNEIGTIWSST